MSGGKGGGGPQGTRRPSGEVTISDSKLTEQLASRVKREVALERASEEVGVEDEEAVEAIDIVVESDGSPRISSPPPAGRTPKK